MPIAKLIIPDEVNVKIDGLTPETRRKLNRKFSYEVPGARFMPSVKLGRWDGRVTFFQMSGHTYINLLPEIIPILDEEGYEIEIEDLRDYCKEFVFDTVTEDSFSHILWPDKHPLSGQPIMLRPDQVESINNCLANTQSLSSLATGFGKTISVAALSQRCEKYGRTLVIVPNQNLVTQTEADYKNLQLDTGVFYGNRKEFGKTHTICTWQSLNSLIKRTKNDIADIPFEEFIDGVEAVIVDECFHPDTIITTTDGLRRIADIRPGDTIINYNENDKVYKSDTVVKVHKNLTISSKETFYAIRFTCGKIIRVTGNHKFLTNEGWVRADMLRKHHLIYPNHAFLSKEAIVFPDVVYNLHIKDDHNYLAEGIVVANCHQLKAAVLKDLLTNQLSKIQIRWGLTGTIPKAEYEYRALQVSIGDIVNHVSAKELQDRGILSNCHVNIRQLIDYGEYAEYAQELKYLLTNRKRIEYIGKMIQEIAKSGNTLVLVNLVETCELLSAVIPGSVVVNGTVKADDRKEEYDKIEAGGKSVIVATYGVASTGISITAIYNMVLIEPGKSFIRVIQSIGRGLRKGFDKNHVEIWDIASTLRFSKRHLAERKKYYNESQYPFDLVKIDWQNEQFELAKSKLFKE